jgi:hypothetical protein
MNETDPTFNAGAEDGIHQVSSSLFSTSTWFISLREHRQQDFWSKKINARHLRLSTLRQATLVANVTF